MGGFLLPGCKIFKMVLNKISYFLLEDLAKGWNYFYLLLDTGRGVIFLFRNGTNLKLYSDLTKKIYTYLWASLTLSTRARPILLEIYSAESESSGVEDVMKNWFSI